MSSSSAINCSIAAGLPSNSATHAQQLNNLNPSSSTLILSGSNTVTSAVMSAVRHESPGRMRTSGRGWRQVAALAIARCPRRAPCGVERRPCAMRQQHCYNSIAGVDPATASLQVSCFSQANSPPANAGLACTQGDGCARPEPAGAQGAGRSPSESACDAGPWHPRHLWGSHISVMPLTQHSDSSQEHLLPTHTQAVGQGHQHASGRTHQKVHCAPLRPDPLRQNRQGRDRTRCML